LMSGMKQDSEVLDRAVRLLVEAAHPAKIILFGSQARGEAQEHNDLDLIVVLETAKDRWSEMVRLQRILSELRLPIDLLVFTKKHVEEWGNVRGTVLYPALREGRVLYGAA
jgi:uncharacterized protein